MEFIEENRPSRATYTVDEYDYFGADDAIASALRVKCAVIDLAEQQMRRVIMGDTDVNRDGDPAEMCERSWCKIIWLLLLRQVRGSGLEEWSAGWWLAAAACALVALLTALLAGAATCGTCTRNFNSPVLTCLNHIVTAHDSSHLDTPLLYHSIT